VNEQQHRPVQPIRPAATVIIVRQADSGFEIFMLKRASESAFAGGMYVFPGGRVDPDDHLHKYDAWRRGPSPAQAAQMQALGDEWRGETEDGTGQSLFAQIDAYRPFLADGDAFEGQR